MVWLVGLNLGLAIACWGLVGWLWRVRRHVIGVREQLVGAEVQVQRALAESPAQLQVSQTQVRQLTLQLMRLQAQWAQVQWVLNGVLAIVRWRHGRMRRCGQRLSS